MIYFIYPLKQSQWGEEIRYSLRSLCDNFTDPFEVVLVGDYLPDWYSGKYIQIQRNSLKGKEWNLGKILKSLCSNLEGHFFWINDDVYLLKPTGTAGIEQPYIVQDLEDCRSRGGNNWQNKLWETFDKCRDLGLSGLNFETHLPYLFEVKALKKVLSMFDVESGDHLPATAYFNTRGMTGEKAKTVKCGVYSAQPHLPEITNKHIWLNHDNNGLTNFVKMELSIRFPSQSRFEHAGNISQ